MQFGMSTIMAAGSSGANASFVRRVQKVGSLQVFMTK